MKKFTTLILMAVMAIPAMQAKVLTDNDVIVGKGDVRTTTRVATFPVKPLKVTKVTKMRADVPEGYAQITLTAGDLWGDGSGYQMLLDADATAYGTIIPETGPLTSSGNANAATYAEFEYKIPEDADGVLTTSNIVIESSVTITIPAGTYDWCITNPTPGDRIWIASSNGNVGGRADNYEFVSGTAYEFTLSRGISGDQVDLTIDSPTIPTDPAEITLTANDIVITSEDQCNTMIELAFNLNNPDYPNSGSWADRGWWKNIQIEMLLPDFVKPYLFYDEEEDASYYGKAGADIRKSSGAPVVCFTDDVDVKNPVTGEITHNDGPKYIIVGANINAVLTGNGEIYVFFVQVPKEAKADLVNGTYPIKVYSKVILGDDSSVQIGTPEEMVDLCNVIIDIPFVPATGISLSSSNESILLESTLQLTANLSPSSVTNKTVIWNSSNTSVAVVDSTGLVTGVGLGTAVITATTTDGTNLSASCQVTVNPILASSVTLDKSNEDIYVDETVQLTATVLPDNTTNKAVIWCSGDTSIATVDQDGLVTGIAPGNVDITVTTADGSNHSAICQITVLPILVSQVSLNLTETTIRTRDKFQLSATIQPSNATYKTLDWSSSDDNIATVTNNGLVTAVAPGDATITATTTDGSDITASCQVTVIPPLATSLTFDNDELTLNVGDDYTMTATIVPSDASQSLVWDSNMPSVATIDQDGVIHAVAAGTAVISASTTDGSDLTSTCILTVIPRLATGISLDKSESAIELGECTTLVATVLPGDATNKTVTWNSSNTSVATVDDTGMVTGVSPGTATITATTTDGTNLSASCAMTVIEAWVSQIVLDKTETTIYLERSDTLHATVLPVNATFKTVTWSSSDDTIVSVDENGIIVAHAEGSATITVAATDGHGASATCLVTVPEADGNYLSAESFTIVLGNEVIVPIAMTNSSPITSMQCELRLTGGIEVALDEYGEYNVYLSDRANVDHELNCTQRPDYMQILAASITAKPFLSNMGTLFYIHLVADKDLEEGTYMMALRNITLSTTTGERIHPGDVEVTIGIEPYMLGDANGDNHVDVADFVTTANYILYKDPFPFYFRAADVDRNGSVDANDLTGITRIGLGLESASGAPRHSDSSMPEPTMTASISGSVLTLGMNNAMPLSAVQLDMLLPEGVEVADASPSSRITSDHELGWNTTPEGMVRLLVASPSAASLNGNNGDLVTVHMNGAPRDNDNVVRITNIIASEPGSIRHELDDVYAIMELTGVNDLTVYKEIRIYAEDGSIVIETPNDGVAQLIQVNGMVTPLRVKAGRNVHPMNGNGIVIVKLSDTVAKIRY